MPVVRKTVHALARHLRAGFGKASRRPPWPTSDVNAAALRNMQRSGWALHRPSGVNERPSAQQSPHSGRFMISRGRSAASPWTAAPANTDQSPRSGRLRLAKRRPLRAPVAPFGGSSRHRPAATTGSRPWLFNSRPLRGPRERTAGRAHHLPSSLPVCRARVEREGTGQDYYNTPHGPARGPIRERPWTTRAKPHRHRGAHRAESSTCPSYC
jgi:hypothetical protein